MSENNGARENLKPTANEDITFVGERNAILFSAGSGEPLPSLELPDDFFELKKDDVRLLYKEMKESREQLESMPFRTKAVREMEENAATLSRLNRYTQTVLRIQFPDQVILQAVFNHSETIQTVMDFVRNFLDPSDVQFQLYTAPPKSILKPELTLIDAKLTPRAVLYFSADPQLDQATFLKDSLLASITNHHLASEDAFKYRRKESLDVKPEESADSEVSQEVPSTSSQRAGKSANSSKVPKWFKK